MNEIIKKILLFDIDGTLLDPAGFGRTCCQRALEDVLEIPISAESVEMAGRTDWQIVNDFLAQAGLDETQIEVHRQAVFAALTHHIEKAAASSRMYLLPGVKPLLNRLAQDSNFLLGLVTGNLRQTVIHKLRAVGIEPNFFSFGAFGDEHYDRNCLPSLAIKRASQLLGYDVSPQEVLVIGDTPHDIACTHHTGLKVLSVSTGLYAFDDLAKSHPDFLLEDLSDTDLVIEIFQTF